MVSVARMKTMVKHHIGIGCMPSRQNNKILITVFVIIISYILSVLFDKIYKKIYIQGEKQL